MIVSAMAGSVDEASRFAKLALRLLDRRGDFDEMTPRVYLGVYAFVHPDLNPLRDSLEPLLRSHRMHILSGDVEVRFIFSFLSSWARFSGPLSALT